MIYKLLNYIFGWDYIAWTNSSDQGIARVHVDQCGTVFYWRYRNIKVADHIRDAGGVLWLTCKPEKYLTPVHDDLAPGDMDRLAEDMKTWPAVEESDVEDPPTIL